MKVFKIILFFIFSSSFISSCKKFLEVELPKSKITAELVFSSDLTATSAITAIYADMLEQMHFASGSDRSISAFGGLSSDELITYSSNNDIAAINQNALLATNSAILDIWRFAFKTLYDANRAIEGLNQSDNVSASVKKQLLGEARFVRAFCNFYLVNLFGKIPLITSADYHVNATLQRDSVETVNRQIIEDLKFAQENLSAAYVTAQRVRPNQATAAALLARVYLYQEDWENAEATASSVINNPLYKLTDMQSVFLKTSTEAIWQLIPVNPDINSQEGYFFILGASPVEHPENYNTLTQELIDAFEPNDLRATEWIGSYTENASTWYYPYKYKIKMAPPVNEYTTVFRLAEQYLIRSEARAQQNKLTEAIADIDSVRKRANVPLISVANPSISQTDLLTAIHHERQVELFTEWGHRWFDLKRWNLATTVLSPLKQDWSGDDELYPIPESEIKLNRNLLPQNPQY